MYLENGQTKAFKFEPNTTVKVKPNDAAQTKKTNKSVFRGFHSIFCDILAMALMVRKFTELIFAEQHICPSHSLFVSTV